MLVAAALIGLSLARFVTRPLRGLEDAAAAVGEGDLDARAPEQSGPPEVRSLAAVFNETVAKLGQLLRSQEEFVADASHELRTPLTALRLRLENLEAELDDDGRRAVDAALREVERLSQMVDGLLALARADAGATPAGRVDAAALVRERVATWQALADERGLTLVADAGGAVPVRASPERIAQVLDNLVANAIDHAPEGTTVTVTARTAGPLAELHVLDDGPGMTAEQRARAFDRFWRAGSGHGGSGLGLAIVRRLVEADEGEVELAEAPGRRARRRRAAAQRALTEPFRFADESWGAARPDLPGSGVERGHVPTRRISHEPSSCPRARRDARRDRPHGRRRDPRHGAHADARVASPAAVVQTAQPAQQSWEGGD